MFAHESVPHLSSQHALAIVAKNLSFHIKIGLKNDRRFIIEVLYLPYSNYF